MQERKTESYSSLSLIKQCPYQYKLKYIDKIYKDKASIALKIGNLCHKILELQRDPTSKISLKELNDILQKGYYSEKENIDGIEKISKNFYEEFVEINSKSNLSYIEKIKAFEDKIKSYKPDSHWRVVATELPFELQYGEFILNGKIDRIDKNEDGFYRVVDYKTSNAVYKDKDLATPLQMFIYALAIKEIYGEYPIEFVYDFVLLNETKTAMKKGWESRGKKALDNIVKSRKEYYDSNIFPPKPTPLCYWCDYREEECEYYSLWSPINKTFEVNKEYEAGENKKSDDWW